MGTYRCIVEELKIGNIRATAAQANSIIDRLVFSDNDCLEWPGTCDRKGYPRGQFNKQGFLVYKFVFEFQCGPIPEGKELHHSCRNKKCCNLYHLLILNHTEHFKLHRRKNPPPTSSQRDSKLTETDVKEIQRLYSTGCFAAEIARHYQIPVKHVMRFISGKYYRHLL